ncbi:MAG: PRD domain-containing protein [Eubacteriales bacterium]|nr:PRD domain-containing protein [Eubacteriales bacterium]
MQISKIYNNNVVQSMDEHGHEIIVMGRGIAFGRKPGEPIEIEKIEKTFTQIDQNMTRKLVSLLAEIPLDYFELVDKIIQDVKIRLGKKLNDTLTITLTDHIYFAVKRIRDGIIVKNGLLWETKRIYPDEFAIGKQALLAIDEKFQVTLPEDEAAFIALHLINAQLDEELPTVMAMTKIMKSILEIVRIHFMITLDEESLNYYRFITHLKYFTQRLVTAKLYSDEQDDELFQMVRKKYPETYRCTEKIKNFIQNEYNYNLTNEELLYFTVHLERLIKNTKD